MPSLLLGISLHQQGCQWLLLLNEQEIEIRGSCGNKNHSRECMDRYEEWIRSEINLTRGPDSTLNLKEEVKRVVRRHC